MTWPLQAIDKILVKQLNMNDSPATCPKCNANDIRYREKRQDWFCDECDHRWTVGGPDQPLVPKIAPEKIKLFISYGRGDAKELADRLSSDLAAAGYEVWKDTKDLTPGTNWQHEIVDGLRSAQVVIALLSRQSVRVGPTSSDGVDSVCLSEIAFALFNPPPTPVIPVMAQKKCEPPLCIYHLDYTDMCAWQDSPEQYQAGLERLLIGIGAALKGEKRFRKWYHQLKPWDFAAILYERRHGFVGREWLFDEIDTWRSCHQESALLITGDPGTGKSAIVAELVHRNPHGQVIAYHCCQADTKETLQPWRFVRSIAAMIASKIPEYAHQLDDPDIQEALSEISCRNDAGSAFERGVLTPLQAVHAPEEGVRYILVDALDEAVTLDNGSNTIVRLLSTRLNRLPPWLRIVATTRKDPGVIDRLSALRAKELNATDPRNLNDIDLFIESRLKTPNLAAKLSQSSTSVQAAADTLHDKSEGNFLYVRQALDAIERDQYSFDRLDDLPRGLGDLYLVFLERNFPDETSFQAVRRLLEVVVAAAEPLTHEQLASVTGLDSRRELFATLNKLSAFVPARSDADGVVHYAVYHKSLADWLTDSRRAGGIYSIDPSAGHRQLSEAGLREFNVSSGSMSPYYIAHLPTHLIEAEQWEQLETLLTDIFYLEVKAVSGLVFDLAADFAVAVASLPDAHPNKKILRLLSEALRRDIHFIARHADDYPQGLFQCLWNSCWWYDCDDAARYYMEPEDGWTVNNAPWLLQVDGKRDTPKLGGLLRAWRTKKEQSPPRFHWLRSHRPPSIHLDSAQLAVLSVHEDCVTSVAFSPDGRQIVSGSNDKTLRVWDAETGEQIRCLSGHESPVWSVAFSPDSRQIVSGSDDKTLRVWDAETGEQIRCLSGHEKTVRSVAFSPDGRQVVSGSVDKTLRVWNAETGEQIHSISGHENTVNSVAFSPDGRQIVSGSNAKTLRVWDAETGEQIRCLSGHEGSVRSVAFSPDGRQIVSGSDDKTMRVWDAETGEQIHYLSGHEYWVISVAFSPDGRQIVSSSLDEALRVWDAETGEQIRCLSGHESLVRSVAFSPDGRQIVSGSYDETLRVWDAETGEQIRCLSGHEGLVWSVAFSPDSRQIVSGSHDKTFRVWDADTGEQIRCLSGHENHVTCVAFSPDGRQIVSGSDDKTLRVWDAETGECLEVIEGTGDVAAIAEGAAVFPFRALGRGLETVVEASDTGEVLAMLPGSAHSITTHPSGRTWAGSAGNHIYLFSLEGGE